MKTICRFLLAVNLMLLAAGSWAQAPGPLAWSSGPDLPSPRAESVAVLAPDDAVILLGGTSPGGSQVVPRLLDGSLAWSAAPNLDITRVAPGAVRFGATGILVFGGRGGNQPTDEALLYDYYLGDSQDADQMAAVRQQMAFADDDTGRIYALGGLGQSGQILSSAERYDPNQDAWSGMAALPAGRYGATAVSVEGTNVIVFGGAASGGVVQSNVYLYSIGANSWSSLTPLPVAVRNAVAVRFGSRVYVTGGLSSTGAVSLVQVYDLETGLWSMDNPLPARRHGHSAVLAASGRLLIAGGYDASSNATTSVWLSQQLDVPETAPVFTSAPVTSGSLDHFYSYDAAANGNPAPTFSMVSGPAGLSVDSLSGLISWQPVAGQAGTQSVTLRATNRVGFADQSFNINVLADTIAPTAPTNVQVVNVTASSVELAWSGAADANGVVRYGVYRQYRCGFHGIQRCYALVLGNITSNTVTIGGLPPLTSYSYVVRAFDAAGNQSPNSMLVSFRTLSPPVNFRYTGTTSLPANFPLALQFFASANPAATFSVVSGPAGLSVDPVTGVANWTPTPADIGPHALLVRAENSGGSAELSVTLTVRPDVPQLSVQFIPGAGGARDAVAGFPYAARILDGSHTPSTFALVSAPAGMSIDPTNGLISWLPTPDDAGQKSVTVRATNAASSAEIIFEFYCHFTGPVSNIQVTGLTDLNPTATWSPPVGVGADRTAGYTIVARGRYRSGRAWRTQTLSFESDGATPSITLTGLVSGRSYSLYVNAIDEADHRGLANSNGVPFVPRPALPAIGWAITNASGGTAVIAGQQALVTLTDLNPTFGPTSYSVITAPAGFVLDSVTGQGNWTPTAADVGTASVTVRAVNTIGAKDVTFSFPVYFSGPVRNATATRTGDVAEANWQPPTDNALPVSSFRVTMHWQVSSRSYSRAMTTTGTSLSFGLTPTGAVWHKGVTITPLDAAGRAGVSTPLIPYNAALPAGLPPADPAWIEQVAIAPDGTPIVEIRGLAGVVAELQVSDDLVDWDFVETVTLGEDGLAQCPDLAGQSAPRGFYRVVIP